MHRLIPLATSICVALPALAQDRHALVVGVADYTNISPLERATQDVQAISKALEHAGYDVTTVTNPDIARFAEAVVTFSNDIQSGDDVVFYYTGRAVSTGGETYLLSANMPADASAQALYANAPQVSSTIKEITKNNPRTSMLILDAHHRNPFPEDVAVSHLSTTLEPGDYGDSLVLFSSGGATPAPSRWSKHDKEDLSPFARELLQVLGPNLSLDYALKHLRFGYQGAGVRKGYSLLPVVYGNLPEEPINLFGRPDKAPVDVEARVCQREQSSLWNFYRTRLYVVRGPLFGGPGLPCQAKQILRRVDEEYWGTASYYAGNEDPFATMRLRRDLSLPQDMSRALKACVTGAHPDVLLDDQTAAFNLKHVIEACGKAVQRAPDDPLANALLGRMLYVTGNYSRALPLLHSAADAGNSMAMFQIGEAYGYGFGVEHNMDTARQWYEKAAAAGNWDADRALGMMFLMGDGVAQDFEQGRAHLERTGDPVAKTLLGHLYMSGQGVEQDTAKAGALYQEAAELGSTLGMYHYADWLDAQGGGDKAQESLKWYLRAARLGNADAKHALGLKYRQGKGVDQNETEALYWLRNAAADGNEAAIAALGDETVPVAQHDMSGVSVPNPTIEQITASAEAGNIDAMMWLASAYHKGDGVEKSVDTAVVWLTRAAEAGDKIAMGQLGGRYLSGKTIPQDIAKARLWLNRAAEAGNGDAMADLGWMYEHGEGIAADPETAFNWYVKAAKAGSRNGMTNLGVAFEHGMGTEANLRSALEWYRKAADLGDENAQRYHDRLVDAVPDAKADPEPPKQPLIDAAEAGDTEAMMELIDSYEEGYLDDPTGAEALKWLIRAAEAGSPRAMVSLGQRYLTGDGVKQDTAAAFGLFQQAADDGYFTAMFELGRLYDLGLGTAADPEIAAKWYKDGAALGDPQAMHAIATAYLNGRGVDKDSAKALDWMTKSASAGNPYGLADLGWIYDVGAGVQQDPVRAAELYTLAAESGNTAAMVNLGLLYLKGRGVAQNGAQAGFWFNIAARQGRPNAMWLLAELYANGEAGEKDPKEAARWYLQSISSGDPRMLNKLNDLPAEVQQQIQVVLSEAGLYDHAVEPSLPFTALGVVSRIFQSGQVFHPSQEAAK